MKKIINIRNERNSRTKRENGEKKSFMMLIKLLMCIIVINNAFIIYNDKKSVQLFPYVGSDRNDGIVEISDDNSDIENSKSDNVIMVNDNRGVPVICYHSVTDNSLKQNPIVISKDKIREQLQTIKDNGYITLSMKELNDYLFKNKPIPEKSVIITFDDGYRDIYINAFPILKELNMKATIFVISSYINSELYLTGDQIKEMNSYGIDVESHTVSHKNLSSMSYADQLKELKESKEKIESITHKPVFSVAYPEGKYNNNTEKAVIEAGYSMGFTIERGYADRSDNLSQLNRICVDYTYNPKNILYVLKSLRK